MTCLLRSVPFSLQVELFHQPSILAPLLYFHAPHSTVCLTSLEPRKFLSGTNVDMAEWSPPASGTPCWLNLPARDVGRGKLSVCEERESESERERGVLYIANTKSRLTALHHLSGSFHFPSDLYQPSSFPLRIPFLTKVDYRRLALTTLPAAKQFYTAAFNWAFMPHDAQSQQYPPDRIAFFHAPDKTRSPGGAISKVDNSGDEAALRKYATANHGTATMYLFVSDLGEYLKVSTWFESRSGGSAASSTPIL